MPIRFRCSYCNRLLGIATRKAGTQTRCPHCSCEITVPFPDERDSKTEQLNLADVEQLLGHTPAAEQSRSDTEALSIPHPRHQAGVSSRLEKSRSETTGHLEPASRTNPSPAENLAAEKQFPVKSAASPHPSDTRELSRSTERPLFEGDVDEILGVAGQFSDLDSKAEPPSPAQQPLQLKHEAGSIVISGLTATLIVVVVVVLMALAFAGGYFLSPIR